MNCNYDNGGNNEDINGENIQTIKMTCKKETLST